MTALIWIALIAVNGWSMIDNLNKGHNKMACLSAFALGFMTLGIVAKYMS